jgi:hypothetical protein
MTIRRRLIMARQRFTWLIIIVLLVTGGCSPSSAGPEDLPTECRIEPLDQLSEETSVMTESGEVFNPDVQYYANDIGVDVEEAAYRLSLQESIGRLNACLNSEEKDTFAGLWIEHEPGYQVFAAFTRDGENTLEPYLTGSALEDIVTVRSAAVTYEETGNPGRDGPTVETAEDTFLLWNQYSGESGRALCHRPGRL